ncbi:alpha/beta hydrolase [Rhodococcus sp. NPDC059968]|uniref:alpha/beta hydrolase n=1 Tax=Rhodococcus sp. NPDC059968 TaxID=3347017 RepID=UPI00366ECD08
MREDIEFATEDGTVLRGYLHSSGTGPAPCIVMAHGFSGVKEQIDHYAAAFCSVGFTVLVYDHRGFGSSEGTPRLEVDPPQQIADWRDAITHAASLPQVDAERGFAIWGSSFAGGLAVVVGANDSRVRCVVSQIPNVSGHRNGREMFTIEQRREITELIHEDRKARLKGAAPAMIDVFGSDPDALCALPPVVHPRFIELSIEGAPSWKNEVTVRSVGHMIEFEPAGWIPHLSPKPWLMIVGREDNCTFPEIQLEAYASAREPKKVVIHPGGHFQTYTKHFEQTSRAATEWFVEHMLGGETLAPSRREEHVPETV